MNRPVLPLLDGTTFVIDNSSLESFTTCPRLGEYTISRRLRPTGERVPLKFGGIIHKVLEARYRSGLPMYEQTPEVEDDMLATAYEAYANWSPPEDDYRTLDCAVSLIKKYGLAYPLESFDIVKAPNGVQMLEQPFALPLGSIAVNGQFMVQVTMRQEDGSIIPIGDPILTHLKEIHILFCGRIDMVYHDAGGIYVMDHKTSSMATNMAEFELSHQFQGYTWAVQTLLGKVVNGVCINRIVCRKPSRTGEAFTFERRLFPTEQGLVSEWHTDILHIIADFFEMVRRAYLPKHTAWCVGKFGTCPFHQVCKLPSPDQREILLQSGEYESNTWSPLHT